MKLLKVIIIFTGVFIYSQNTGLQLKKGTEKTAFRFKLVNNLILIPVTVNGVELTFLLDSGVADTFLFSTDDKEITFNNVQKIKFTGLGGDSEVDAYKSIENKISFGKHFSDSNHTIYIILDENINISQHVGIPINGVIGYDFLKNYPVSIDYVSKKITIYNHRERFQKALKNYTSFPITIEQKKPYTQAGIQESDILHNYKLLIDTGNSDAVWLFPGQIQNFTYRKNSITDYLGQGFNGSIYGKRSRIRHFSLGDFEFEKPTVALPDQEFIQHLSLVKNRKGSMGGEILKRFSLIFDYPENKIYLKKNRNYYDPFLINMSGLDFKQTGVTWEKDVVKINNPKAEDPIEVFSNTIHYKFSIKPVFAVIDVRKNSPADLAGVRKDDIIISINRKSAKEMSLEKIYDIMKNSAGKTIEMEIERNKKVQKIKFVLDDPIPYEDEN